MQFDALPSPQPPYNYEQKSIKIGGYLFQMHNTSFSLHFSCILEQNLIIRVIKK